MTIADSRRERKLIPLPHHPDHLHEGERRKHQALAAFERQLPDVLTAGRRALLVHLLAHGHATADDVRAAVPVPPGVNPKVFGGVPGPLAKCGIITADGFARTRRGAAHARPVSRWKLADEPAAVRWLDENPAPTADAAKEVSE